MRADVGTCQVHKGGACRQAAGTKVKDIKRQERLTICSASQEPKILLIPKSVNIPLVFIVFLQNSKIT